MKKTNFKKLVNVIIVLILLIVVGVNIKVSATTTYTTYDKQGNKVQITQEQVTSMTNGTVNGEKIPIMISCSELGTKVYFNTDGTVKQIVDLSTGKILFDYTNSVETTTAAAQTATATAATTATASTTAKTWNKKVTKVKKKTVYKTYKGYKSLDAKKMTKIKYKYGFKITWKKIAKAKGYQIQRYENAKKCWTTIKTIKKNRASYTITNLMRGENVKIRIRAYKGSGKKKVYGKWSKTLKFTTKGAYTKLYNGGIDTKTFISKWAAEDAFVIQNQYRKEAGVSQLTWSDTLYQIGLYRLETSGYDSHENVEKDLKTYANSFGITVQNPKSKYTEPYVMEFGYNENLAAGQTSPKEVMYSWKTSLGHYINLKRSSDNSGAIACIFYGEYDSDSAGITWIATFSEKKNFDTFWNSLKNSN